MDDNGNIKQAIIISDLHCGCQFGLFALDSITLDNGGQYYPSELQKKVTQWWREMWDEWIPDVTRDRDYALVINGDTTDGRHHNAVTQITQNLKDQLHIAKEILDPIVSLPHCKKLFITRGTEAHTGQAGENEDMLAESLHAIPDEIGNYARNELWLRIGGEHGALAHILHHISPAGYTAYETTALMRELASSYEQAARWGYPAPDFCIRSHRHRNAEARVPTKNVYGYSITTPGWQLQTPLVWRIIGGRNSLPQFGGIFIRQGDKEHYSRAFVRNITRTPEVVI